MNIVPAIALTIGLVSIASAQGPESSFLSSDMYCKDAYVKLKSELDAAPAVPGTTRDRLVLEIKETADSCQSQHEKNLLTIQKVHEDKAAAANLRVEQDKASAAYYRAQEERARAAEKAVAKLAALPGAKIGMTMATVINKTSWGEPISVNRTTTAKGVQEQWVYGEGNYLYFVNGKLTAIQN